MSILFEKQVFRQIYGYLKAAHAVWANVHKHIGIGACMCVLLCLSVCIYLSHFVFHDATCFPCDNSRNILDRNI